MLEYSADLDLYMPYIGLHFVKQRAPTSCNSVIKKVVSRTILQCRLSLCFGLCFYVKLSITAINVIKNLLGKTLTSKRRPT